MAKKLASSSKKGLTGTQEKPARSAASDATSKRSQSKREEAAAASWACQKCTYLNPVSRKTCTMCSSRRPKTTSITTQSSSKDDLLSPVSPVISSKSFAQRGRAPADEECSTSGPAATPHSTHGSASRPSISAPKGDTQIPETAEQDHCIPSTAEVVPFSDALAALEGKETCSPPLMVAATQQEVTPASVTRKLTLNSDDQSSAIKPTIDALLTAGDDSVVGPTAEALPTPSAHGGAPDAFMGFTTGMGARVTISAAALKKAEALFEHDTTTASTSPTPPPASDSDRGRSAGSGFVAETPPAPTGFGFETGLGKKVAISEQGLAKAKAMFADLEDGHPAGSDQSPHESMAPPSSGFGFQTGLGKNVAISEKGLAKAKARFPDLEDDGSEQPAMGENSEQRDASTAEDAPMSKRKRQESQPRDDGSSSPQRARSTPGRQQLSVVQHNTAAAPSAAVSRRGGTFRAPKRTFVSPQKPQLHGNVDAAGSSGVRNKAINYGDTRAPAGDAPVAPASNGTADGPLATIHLDLATIGEETGAAVCIAGATDPISIKTSSTLRRCRETLIPAAAAAPALRSLCGLEESTTAAALDAHRFQGALRALGARPKGTSTDWVSLQLALAVQKMTLWACLDGAGSDSDVVLSPTMLLVEIVSRYNAEYVDGRKSALRMIAAKDASSAAPMVLRIADTDGGRSGPHGRVIVLTDGWYTMNAALDTTLSAALSEGSLALHDKLFLCGSRSSIAEGCGPLELPDGVHLTLTANGTRKARDDAPLGFATVEAGGRRLPALPSVPLGSIISGGGLVPSSTVVVTRILPSNWVENIATEGNDNSRGHSGGSRAIRNYDAESEAASSHERRITELYDSALAKGSNREDAARICEKQSRRVYRIDAMIVADSSGEAMVQVRRYRTVTDPADPPFSVEGNIREGAHLRLMNLEPARYDTLAQPFHEARALYATDRLLAFPVDDEPADAPRTGLARDGSLTSVASLCDTRPPFPVLRDLVAVVAAVDKPNESTTRLVLCDDSPNVFVLLTVESYPGGRELGLPPALRSGSNATPLAFLNILITAVVDTGSHTIIRATSNEYSVLGGTTSAPGADDDARAKMAALGSAEAQAVWQRNIGEAGQAGVLAQSAGERSMHTPGGQNISPGFVPSAGSMTAQAGPLPIVPPPPSVPSSGRRTIFRGSGSTSPIQNNGAHAPPPPPLERRLHIFGNIDVSTVRVLNHSTLPFTTEQAASKLYCRLGDDSPPESGADGPGMTSADGSATIAAVIDAGRSSRVPIVFRDTSLLLLAGDLMVLSSTVADDQMYELGLSRGHLLRSLPPAERWTQFIHNSVVVSADVYTNAMHRAIGSQHDESSGSSPATAVSLITALQEAFPLKQPSDTHSESQGHSSGWRWNQGTVSPRKVMWWSEHEFKELLHLVAAALQHRLVKVTVDNINDALDVPKVPSPMKPVLRLYPLAADIPISSLYDDV